MVAVAFASWFITLAVHHWIVYALTFEGEAATEGTLKLDQIVKGAANMVAAALFLVSAKSIKSVEGNKTVAALVAAFGLYSLNLGATNWSDYDKYFEQQDSEDALKAGPCIAAILATLAFTLATWGAVTDILKDGFNAQVAFTFAWSMFFFASTVTTWNTFHKVDLQFKTSPGMPAPMSAIWSRWPMVPPLRAWQVPSAAPAARTRLESAGLKKAVRASDLSKRRS
jgi:hypothetical protein